MLRFARDAVGVASGEIPAVNMKILGFFLLLAGWLIALAALAILSAMAIRGAFVAAGIAVEVIGLVFVIRSHSVPPGLED